MSDPGTCREELLAALVTVTRERNEAREELERLRHFIRWASSLDARIAAEACRVLDSNGNNGEPVSEDRTKPPPGWSLSECAPDGKPAFQLLRDDCDWECEWYWPHEIAEAIANAWREHDRIVASATAELRRQLEDHKTKPDPNDPDGWIRRSTLNEWADRAIKAEREAAELRRKLESRTDASVGEVALLRSEAAELRAELDLATANAMLATEARSELAKDCERLRAEMERTRAALAGCQQSRDAYRRMQDKHDAQLAAARTEALRDAADAFCEWAKGFDDLEAAAETDDARAYFRGMAKALRGAVAYMYTHIEVHADRRLSPTSPTTSAPVPVGRMQAGESRAGRPSQVDSAHSQQPGAGAVPSAPTSGATLTDDERRLVGRGLAVKRGEHSYGVTPAGYDAIYPTRPNHLRWNGTEWVDERCGCRYHPDDDKGSHGGAPHVHLCERHTAARRIAKRYGGDFSLPAQPAAEPAPDLSEIRKHIAAAWSAIPRYPNLGSYGAGSVMETRAQDEWMRKHGDAAGAVYIAAHEHIDRALNLIDYSDRAVRVMRERPTVPPAEPTEPGWCWALPHERSREVMEAAAASWRNGRDAGEGEPKGEP